MIKPIIRETRRDDIIKSRDEWDKQFELDNAAYDSQWDDYNDAEYQICEKVKNEILKSLGGLRDDRLKIDVSLTSHFGNANVRFRFGAPFDKVTSLCWDATISIDKDGQVKKETGSYSGLEAYTPELIKDLKKSTNIIECIMDMDWETILGNAQKDKPKYDDYIKTTRPSRKDRPDFETQLIQTSIEDIIGTTTLISCSAPPSSNYRAGTCGVCQIVGETPQTYRVRFVTNYNLAEIKKDISKLNDLDICGVKKDTFINKLVTKDKDGNLFYTEL